MPKSQTGGGGIALAAGKVWVTGNVSTITAYPEQGGDPGPPKFLPGGAGLLATGFGRIWVQMHDINQVWALDPETGRVVFRKTVGEATSGLATGEGAVWVSNYFAGTVSKIDPTNGKSTMIDIGQEGSLGSFVNGSPAGIASTSSAVWVSDIFFGTVDRIDPATNRIVERIKVGQASPSNNAWDCMTAVAGKVWVTNPPRESRLPHRSGDQRSGRNGSPSLSPELSHRWVRKCLGRDRCDVTQQLVRSGRRLGG